jgi:group I intron endonuclease
MICGIYKITSPTGRIYIGQSKDITRRWSEYFNKKCKGQVKLNHSFKKYGVEAHIFEIVEECEFELLNIRERYWQDIYNCLEDGLNCLLTKTDEKPQIASAKTKQKMSEANKGKRSHMWGKKLSGETRKKMSESRKGKRNPNFGKKPSNSTLLKMSEVSKKKVIDTLTNKIYPSVKEAAEDINKNYSVLSCMLSGYRKNKTSLIYYNENK